MRLSPLGEESGAKRMGEERDEARRDGRRERGRSKELGAGNLHHDGSWIASELVQGGNGPAPKAGLELERQGKLQVHDEHHDADPRTASATDVAHLADRVCCEARKSCGTTVG